MLLVSYNCGKPQPAHITVTFSHKIQSNCHVTLLIHLDYLLSSGTEFPRVCSLHQNRFQPIRSKSKALKHDKPILNAHKTLIKCLLCTKKQNKKNPQMHTYLKLC